MLKDLRRLAQDSTAYRKQGQVWLEGDHLCRAALARGVQPALAAFSESYWLDAQVEWGSRAIKNIVIADALFAGLSGLESPAKMGFVVPLPAPHAITPAASSVILDRVQDAGNVGSILRSASAFGFRQVIALKGTAALWSPKVLRSGMGAHFGLQLREGVATQELQALQLPLLVTSSHEGAFLHQSSLPWPAAWVLGHEGQGVSPALQALAALRIRIAQPGGEESLNVGAAAAICLHASAAGRASGL
ncbi:MAG: RNA methyltransferase [Burkholderiales bacterium]|nr:MAG: RNA methyltransferase [Burkholderiales bacterium]